MFIKNLSSKDHKILLIKDECYLPIRTFETVFLSEPTLVATGANMAADRYADYQLSYTKTAGECKTYININFEVHEVCNLKAFEAYATAVGLVRFQVYVYPSTISIYYLSNK